MSCDRPRRALLAALAAAPLLRVAPVLAAPRPGSMFALARARLAALEQRHGGRLGVAILGLPDGAFLHRADERFPMCSTFKFLAAAHVLAHVDRGEERLDRRVQFTGDALVTYSPVTSRHVGPPGMTMGELCDAAVTVSDNTAGNLLLDALGGPAGLTAFARSMGDAVTRLDRREPELNEGIPGDPRDTTTPLAMAGNLRTLVLDDALSTAARVQLEAWLVANTTGDRRLRAGLPSGWRVGDKTGSAGGITNDIAIAWPPGAAPLVVSAYYAESRGSAEERNAVIAAVGEVTAALAGAT